MPWQAVPAGHVILAPVLPVPNPAPIPIPKGSVGAIIGIGMPPRPATSVAAAPSAPTGPPTTNPAATFKTLPRKLITPS